MSIKIMDMVFKDETLESNKKLVMLAIADNANDQGYCYPSINTISQKTSLSRKTVIKHLKELEARKLLLSKKRSRKNGGRYTTIYIVYPNLFLQDLDEELKEKFLAKDSQGVEATPPIQGVEATPQTTIQGVEATPKPSLTLFNHNLFSKLNKEEKDLFLEYLKLRKKMKLQNTIQIKERLLQKYFEYGKDKKIIENAIMGNWKDFYPISSSKKPSSKSLQKKNKEFVDYLFSKKVHKDVIDVDIVQSKEVENAK